MKIRIRNEWLPLALAAAALLAAPTTQAQTSRPCNAWTNSKPSSLGADGWAAVDGAVTGGCGAMPAKIYNVFNRSQLVNALTGGNPSAIIPDPTPKIIYINGTIDLNVDNNNVPLREEDYMARCNYTGHATFYDPVTGDQTGNGGFFGAYKTAYDPNTWLMQSLDPADNRPPVLTGPLEDARMCFTEEQMKRVLIRVGSNTSLIGKSGTNPKIINGNLQLGYLRTANLGQNYEAENIVIRNITFADSFDMFPGWDPKDSFSITITNTNGCQATYDAANNAGPHRCVARGGRWNSEYDNISVENAERVWIDGNTFTDEPRTDKLYPPVFAAPFNEATQKVQHHDGQVDVTVGGTKVTMSYNVFRTHDKTNLLGGSDTASAQTGYGPGKIDVTFHHNYWLNTVQRMPRVRFGRVHVYNNFYDLDWRSSADYRLGETWTVGTAAKLFAENNVLDVRNTSLVASSKIGGYSSSTSNRNRCTAAGFTLAECGTYFYDAGTIVTTINGATVTTQLQDIYAAVLVKQQSSSSNAPLTKLDPNDPAVFWKPSLSYAYSLLPVSTAAEQAALRSFVVSKAGAGKL
ncbi:pectate lyase family protein [Uliginosibacterium sp. H1]|uniref:pectate lyase family protein n=1 Tax=Uliginosibacterium sp. H1 TaxID=3114757 RepID=UPI002E198C75|nr:hypothetical protein [Uliginosibacterium sp. H1]